MRNKDKELSMHTVACNLELVLATAWCDNTELPVEEEVVVPSAGCVLPLKSRGAQRRPPVGNTARDGISAVAFH
jgi:hypothetical protein